MYDYMMPQRPAVVNRGQSDLFYRGKHNGGVERNIKQTKIRKKETLKNIEVCKNKLKSKKLEYKELLDIFNILYSTFKSFWNFQFFPMGLEFSLNNYGRQDLVLKYKKYMVDIREQSQYITVKLEDLIDIILKIIAKNKKLLE